MECRPAARHSAIILTALALAACLPESGDDASSAAVNLEITAPAGSSAIDTTDKALTIAGTASSDSGIVDVHWANDRGGDGLATGAESWQIDELVLALGENTITVTAEDATGRTASRSLVVNRESGELGSTTLSWTAPTARTDGSPLTNLAGYRIFYGRMSGIYDYEVDIANPGVVTYVVEGLVSGKWYFTLAAYDSDGIESDRSNEVTRDIS